MPSPGSRGSAIRPSIISSSLRTSSRRSADSANEGGAEFTAEGVALAPVLPLATYCFTSPLLGLAKSAAGYSGWYNPPTSHGLWTIRLKLSAEEAAGLRSINVNGKSAALLREAPSEFVIKGEGGAGKRLTWTLSAGSAA
jgi:hypothetical protein